MHLNDFYLFITHVTFNVNFFLTNIILYNFYIIKIF